MHREVIPELTPLQDSNHFADVFTEDMESLNELVQQVSSDATIEEYIFREEDLGTCLTFEGAYQANW